MYLTDCKSIRLRLRTGLVRNCGERDTVQEYIDLIVRRLNCSNRVNDTALKMYNYIAQKTTFTGQSPSTMAIALENWSGILKHQKIPTPGRVWHNFKVFSKIHEEICSIRLEPLALNKASNFRNH